MTIMGIDGPRIGGPGLASDSNQHTVKTGETLDGIAQKLGVGAQELLKCNPGVKDPASIKPGQVLNLPAMNIKKVGAEVSRLAESAEKTASPTIFDEQARMAKPASSESRNILIALRTALPVTLAPGEFQKNEQGHMVVKNGQLTGLFKAILERNPTGATSLSFGRIVPGEPPSLKSASDPTSLNLASLSPATAQFYQEFLARQLGDPAPTGAPGNDAESRIWFAQRQDTGPGRSGEAPTGKSTPQTIQNTRPESQDGSVRFSAGEAHASRVESQLFDVFRSASQSPSIGEARASSPKLDPGDALDGKIELSLGQSPAHASAQKYIPAEEAPVRLSPEQFEINKEGNLVIKSEQLSDLLNAALNAAGRGELVAFGMTSERG